MDMSFCSALQPQEGRSFLFDCDILLDKSCDPRACDPLSDPGYFSACSSLSPASSVDSFILSPNSLPGKTEQDSTGCFIFRGAPHQAATTIKTQPQSASTASVAKKSRSRCPGKKRQTASEREKLRMRDLSKAMHHLRSFLPPSVVPEGQALTKIETLRLTMGYISHLSAQLGLSEECLEHKRASGHMKQDPTIIPLQEIQGSSQPGACPGAYTSPLMISAGLCYTSQCWVLQQQHPHMGFNGQS